MAVERKRYNDAVEKLNGFVRKLGGRIVSSIAGVEKREYFKSSEAAKEVPKVDFSKDE
ncbi:MAG: LemA family protein [Phycisphaerae bacterium]